MGWKAVKDHYRIGHIVHIRDGNLAIGSEYISELILVSPAGELLKPRDSSVADLNRYQKEITDDPELFAKLLAEVDDHGETVTVYTYNRGDIVEKQCSSPGWPNVTTDGELMYDNTHSMDKDLVVRWAKKNALYGIRAISDQLNEVRKRMQDLQAWSSEHATALSKLDVDYPEVMVSLEN